MGQDNHGAMSPTSVRPLKPFMGRYANVILDLDGCVWIGDEALPGSVEAVTAMRQEGKRLAFVTNNAMHSEEDFVRRLWSMGFQASVEEIFTPATAVRALLADTPDWQRALVVGAPALVRAVQGAGLRVYEPDPADVHAPGDLDVVIVAAHSHLRFDDLRLATHALAGGLPLIATDGDVAYPLPGGPCPGTGAIVAALEAASGTQARVLGKPEPFLFEIALERLGPGETLVVGDRLDADIAGAQAAGLDSAIVLTGSVTGEDAAAWTPDITHVADLLGDLVLAGPAR